ncbi:MAG: hypothetical protein Q8930_09910, partial [Bacillota bacterium]|nr:hypothetical protein [Bacillota bacterium]
GGNFNMGKKPLVRIEDHSRERVVSFFVDCSAPEEAAWNMIRYWTTANLKDYMASGISDMPLKGITQKVSVISEMKESSAMNI